MIDIPLGKYFISHSYKDADVRDKMIERLPNGVEPYIFPPISVSPLEFVSNTLIGAILACDGMIYLNEGESAKSFWVAFERDYALRAGKYVYAYSAKTDSIVQHDAPPLNLRIFFSSAVEDESEVRHIRQFMATKRFFDMFFPLKDEQRHEWDYLNLTTGKVQDRWSRVYAADEPQRMKNDMKLRIQRFIGNIGYMVIFWSSNTSKSYYQLTDLAIAKELQIVNRLIFATLEDGLSVPTNADLLVQLYSNSERSQINRIDDLIIRLYWLMYRDQYGSNL